MDLNIPEESIALTTKPRSEDNTDVFCDFVVTNAIAPYLENRSLIFHVKASRLSILVA